MRWCGRQSAAPLGEKRRKSPVFAEWVCVLADSVSVVACWSHVNTLLRAVTRSVARKPDMWSVGGTAQARISGSTCGLEGPRASRQAHVRMSDRQVVKSLWRRRVGNAAAVEYACADVPELSPGTGIRQRRDPEGSRLSLRVSDGQHAPNLSPQIAGRNAFA